MLLEKYKSLLYVYLTVIVVMQQKSFVIHKSKIEFLFILPRLSGYKNKQESISRIISSQNAR